MTYPYYAESKLISDKDAFQKTFYFIEDNFKDSHLENYSYLLMNQFFKDCNGRANGNIGFDPDENHLSLHAIINCKLNGNLELFDGKKECYQSAKLSYFFDRTIETSHILVARNDLGIDDEAIGSMDPILDAYIKNIYGALKQLRFEKEVLKK